MVAHRIAQVMDVSPWEALLLAVRRSATWSAFYEAKVGEAVDDDQLRPGGSHYEWVEALERVTDKMARWSKMAVDAGVARLMVERAQAEGAMIVRVFNEALAASGLPEAELQRLRGALRAALLSEETRTRATLGPAASGDDPGGAA